MLCYLYTFLLLFTSIQRQLSIRISTFHPIHIHFLMSKLVKKLASHNGSFHCDDALAISLLRMLPEYAESQLIRTRDPELLDKCDVVVDVGSIYDPQNCRFDHHQRGFNTFFSDKHHVTKLSASGLIYRHFGKRILTEKFAVKPEHLDIVYVAVYDSFLEAIDAIDNGVEICDGKLKYRDNTGLSSRVALLNPTWLDENPNYDEQFEKAVTLTGNEFVSAVNRVYNIWFPAREIVLNAYNNRLNVHKSGKVIELSRHCPYYEHLYAIEESNRDSSNNNIIYFVIFKTLKQWRCTCMRNKDSSFICRLPFPEHLRGLRGEELVNKSEIENLEFVHHSGFTCGGSTMESIIQLIDMTLAN